MKCKKKQAWLRRFKTKVILRRILPKTNIFLQVFLMMPKTKLDLHKIPMKLKTKLKLQQILSMKVKTTLHLL